MAITSWASMIEESLGSLISEYEKKRRILVSEGPPGTSKDRLPNLDLFLYHIEWFEPHISEPLHELLNELQRALLLPVTG